MQKEERRKKGSRKSWGRERKGEAGRKKKQVRKRGYTFQKHVINGAWKRTEEPSTPGKVMS